jgi:hypothetical protein
MKTRLGKVEDFIEHLKSCQIQDMYFTLVPEDAPLGPETDENGVAFNPPPPRHYRTTLLLTAKLEGEVRDNTKTTSFDRFFSFTKVLAYKVVKEQKDLDDYKKLCEDELKGMFTYLQGAYPSCKIWDGVVE